MGHTPGLALRLLLSARIRRALGRVLTPLLLGLLRLLLWRRNHFEHDVLNGGCYTNAYEIIECSSMMQLLYFNWNALRTVRPQVADRPPPSGGPSAVQLCRPTRTDYLSGQISNLYGGLSALKQRTVHSLTPQNHQRQRRLWTNFKLYGGLSGPPWRTVRSSLCQFHQRR